MHTYFLMSASLLDALNVFKLSHMNKNIQNQLKDGDKKQINIPKIDWLTLPEHVTI